MKLLPLVTILSALTQALPTPQDSPAACDVVGGKFYLVTTKVPYCSTNSSLLPYVSATSIFDPEHQTDFLLRTIAPGYESLPLFTFSNSSLYTYSANNFDQGNYSYVSLSPATNTELEFVQGPSRGAGLGFTAGFMLGFGGVMDQWMLCPGDFGQTVVKWNGTDAASTAACNATYIQAVASPPY